MNTIHLHGALADQFGPTIRLEIATATEAVQALCAVLPGFNKAIQQGAWHVVVGKSPESGLSLDETTITGFKIGARDLHITPALMGAKDSGAMKVIMGVALMATSFGFAGVGIMGASVGSSTVGGMMGSVGFAMATAGASLLLSPVSDEGGNDDASFLMSGPQVTARENSILPIAYGRVITGGVTIAAQIDIEQISL